MYDNPRDKKDKSTKVWLTQAQHDLFCQTVRALGTERSPYGRKVVLRALEIDNNPRIRQRANELYMSVDEFVDYAIHQALDDGTSKLERLEGTQKVRSYAMQQLLLSNEELRLYEEMEDESRRQSISTKVV